MLTYSDARLEEDMARERKPSRLDRVKKALSDIPPSQWLEECQTEEQREKWQDLKLFFLLVREDFSAYGSERESPLDRSPLQKDYKEYVRITTRMYVSLNSAIWEKWGEMKKVIVHLSPDDFGVRSLPKTPEELTSLIILQEARQSFERCLAPNSKLSKNAWRNFLKQGEEIGRLLAQASPAEECSRVRTLRTRRLAFLKDAGLPTEPGLRDFIVGVLERAFSGERGETPIKAYRRHEADLVRLNLKMTHPRNKLGGEVWKDGHRTIIGKGANRYNT